MFGITRNNFRQPHTSISKTFLQSGQWFQRIGSDRTTSYSIDNAKYVLFNLVLRWNSFLRTRTGQYNEVPVNE